MNYGALIVCGGKSTRMGRDKATLPFGDKVMLQRVVNTVGDVVPLNRIAVAAAVGQELPELPKEVRVVRDRREASGPLEGLAAGLGVLSDAVDAAYVSGCDAPLLKPKWIREMFRRLGDFEICVPRDGRYHHPLAAVYRTSIVPVIESLLAADRLRPAFLFDECRTVEAPVEEMRTVDPELDSLRNMNNPEDYQEALRSAGLIGD